MKKIKKILAAVMTLAMVLGMSMTTFAVEDNDPTTSNITVSGLAAEDSDTTVNIYAAITWSEAESRWVEATWAEPYIDISGNNYTINDAESLVAAVASEDYDYQQTLSAGATSVTFENVPVGAYVIFASGTSASYAPMVAETYNSDETYMTAEDVNVIAKTDGYDLTKEQKIEAGGNKFIGRGEEVTFEITTTFPSFQDPDAQDNTFKIIDTPTGLDIIKVESVYIASTLVNVTSDMITETNNADGSTKEYTIDLSNQIGSTNANAGKPVVITYKATVTSETGYTNTANTSRDDVNLGSDTEQGFTGDITITKYIEGTSTVLKEAEFEVYHGTKAQVEADGSQLEKLSFVEMSDGVYKLALPGEAGATTTVTATNGTVQVKGLDEGTYWFKETKAPEGYSINDEGEEVTINVNESANVSETGSVYDTKLGELPSTGGIGTTIFTIGGCIIMIAAAGLFFASRRKSSK